MNTIPKHKGFNPEYSYYHWVMVNKYIRQGYTKRTAFKKAKKEYEQSLKQVHLFGR